MANDLDELKELLVTSSKHGNYGMIPPALLKVAPPLASYSYSRRLDEQRYNWFSNKINFKGKKIMDIGANVGYFSLRLATEYNSTVIAYEPFAPHSHSIELSKNILNLADDKFSVINDGVSFDKISSLEKVDIVLFLNVLQHAGEDYDAKYVKSIADWRTYAVQYLTKLKEVSEYMVFQMGYTWLGHEGKLCKDEDILDYTIKILMDSGWSIMSCGFIADLDNLTYVDYTLNESGRNHSPFTSRRDSIVINLRRRLFGYKQDHRFMQRPLFICKSSS